MSNMQNDQYIENLQDRFSDIAEFVRPDALEVFQRLIVTGDLEGAEAYIEILEALYAEDLREVKARTAMRENN